MRMGADIRVKSGLVMDTSTTWSELMVSMMSAEPASPSIFNIKKEDEGNGFRSCSPTNSTMYSPTTTSIMHGSEMEYSEGGVSGCGSPSSGVRLYDEPCSSPGSPDRNFCSSTTQPGEGAMGRMEEGMKELDSPKRMCLVCGDVASGFHYGVASCEACKAFFKRTIQGNIEYTCPASNDCEINKRRRKACQACRFQKCLRMGMLKEGVRLDRVRGGRQKYRRSADSSSSTYSLHSLPIKKPSLEDNKILVLLSTIEPDTLVAFPEPKLLDSDYRTISILSELYDRELVSVIGWAKQVPGFTDLSLNDQMRLLQSTWAEILTLSLAYRSLQSTGRLLQYATDFTLDEKQARECGASELYQHYMQVVERLEKASITKEEYVLLKALVLANSDVRVEEVSVLNKLRESILTSLNDCVSILRAGNPSANIHSLLLCLPCLRQVDCVVRKFWSSIHRDGKATMNKLFIEMLEAHLR